MMLYPAMNKLTQYIPNRYMMVNVVARRAVRLAGESGKDLSWYILGDGAGELAARSPSRPSATTSPWTRSP